MKLSDRLAIWVNLGWIGYLVSQHNTFGGILVWLTLFGLVWISTKDEKKNAD
jgi:hypothetical protein